MAQYVNGHFVGRKAAAADPFSQSQSTVGADWPSAALELSLPTSQILHAENQHVACLGIGPGGLFEGLEDSQGQQEVAAPVQPQLNLQAPEVLQPSAMPPAAQTNTQTAMEHLHKCAEVQQWHKSLAPFDADHCMVGQHTILCRIGKGGFATVFLAEDTSAGKHVAFKVTTKPLIVLEDDLPQPGIGSEAFNKNLQEQSWEYRCFKREADLFRQLGCFQPGVEKHGLPQCLEAGFVTIGSRKVHGYMTMQLLGKTVYDTEIYRRRMSDHKRFVEVAQCMLRSLQYMHKKGVIHRDVKPGNFCLNLDSNKKPITFCIDLGLSKPAPTKENAHMHQQFQGTPDYASTRGLLNRFQGACDDLESLAFCLLELWNGKLHWDVTNSSKWPLSLYYQAMREAKQACDDGNWHELEWSDANLARMARLRDEAFEDLKRQGGVPRFLVQWIKYVRRLQPYQEPSYQLLHDYIANSGGSSTGSTALWDTRDDWKLTRNSHKRAAAESTHKGGFDLFEHESSSDEKDVEEEEVEAAHYQQLRHACKKQKLDLEILSTQPEA